MINNVLQSIGLNQKEIMVYLAILKLGTQPASIIARSVGTQRNTTRFILDKLVDNGLVRKSTKANTQLYTPEAPKNIIKLLEGQRRRINEESNEEIKQLKKIIPELKSKIRPKSSKPKVTYYEGKDGLIKAYEDTLKTSDMIHSFACYDVIHGEFQEYFSTYYKRRAKNKIPIKCIHLDTKLGRLKAKRDKNELRESRLLPANKYYYKPEIQFYDDKVSIASWEETLGIIIESHEIRELFQVIFDLAWKEADRIDPRKKRGEKIYRLKDVT